MTATPDPDSVVPDVLSVAASDALGATGLAADLKTFALLGVQGSAVVTMIGVGDDALPVPPRFVLAQLEAALDQNAVQTLKLGLMGTASVADVVAQALATRGHRSVVVDPVLPTGAARDGLLAALRDQLLPLATLVTPNAAEAGALLGTEPPRTLAELQDCARAIARLGPQWVLVTGGAIDAGTAAVDVLSDGTDVQELRVPRVGTEVSGAGDTFSAAVAALLALGGDVPTACGAAQRYVAASIEAADTNGGGRGVRRPLRHLPWGNAGQDVRAAMERPRRRWK